MSAMLTDTRITAELWLANDGDYAVKRNRAHKRAEKKGGEYRSFLVRFADGFEVTTGSYCTDNAVAVAAVIRFARSRHMESTFAADERERRETWRAEVERMRALGCIKNHQPRPSAYPFRDVLVKGVGPVRTRIAPTPDVVSVQCGNVEMIGALAPAAKPARAKSNPLAKYSEAELWAELERREDEARVAA